MTKELMNLCNRFEVKDEARILIESIENCYKVIFKGNLVEYINKNITNKNFESLNEKERFFYILKDINSEIMCYYALGIHKPLY